MRDQFLGIPFLYFILSELGKNHIVLCREIINNDEKKYSDLKFFKTKYNFFFWIDKIYSIILKTPSRIFNDWWSYKRYLRNYTVEKKILHAHMGPQGFHSIPLANYFSIPLLVTFYGSDMSAIPKIKNWKNNYLELFHNCRNIIVEGNHMRDRLLDLGCPSEKVVVIPLLIKTKSIKFRKKENPLGTYNKTIKILMCANFYPKKGYLTAIKVLEKLRLKYKIQICIIGDGPLKEKIIANSNTLKKEKLIDFIGKLGMTEILILACEYDIFFHPSETALDGDTEGGAPTIISQMQAVGLPIISTKHADIPNVIPKENHFLGDEKDINSIITQFQNLLDIQEWGQIQERGRRFVESKHSEEVIKSLYEELYSNIK